MEDVFRTRLKLIYDSVQSYINSAQCALKKLPENDANFNELELTGSKLKGANERFVSEIHSYCKSIKEPDVEQISLYTSTQIQAEDLISEIDVCIRRNDRKRASITNSGENLNITSKLPRMELSKFDGDVLKWYQFWDQFSSNVDSRNISDVDKLLYLQSILEGDAKQAIEGLDTTNKNYSIAVRTLKERYGKPVAIIDAHYVALYRIKSAATNQVKDCRHVLNEIERHLRVLSSLGEDVNHNHLRVMILEKFPEDLIYELRMKMTGEDEKIDSIRKYLEYIISAREASNRLKKDTIGLKNTDTTNGEGKDVTENFTSSSLHVKSEEKRENTQRKFTNFRKDRPKFDNRQFNKSQTPRKRPLEISDRTDEPPKKKFSRCIFCRQGHFNDECTTYKTMRDRKSQLGNRCYNCFREGHRADHCRSKRKCRHCNEFGNHNRALCPTKFIQPVKSIQTDSLHIRSEVNTTLLQTCIANVRGPNTESRQLQCRILLDCGSQRSYITECTAKSLKLPVTEKINLSIFTFGAKSPHQIESPVVNFKITTRTGVTRLLHANVVPHITQGIRTPNSVTVLSDIRLKDLTMADDGSCGNKIDILIGNDYYHSFMSYEKISVAQDLFLVNSDFGWVWSGQIREIVDSSDQLTVLTYFQSDGIIDNKLNEPDLPLKIDDVKRLWDLESIGITDSPKSTRDEEAIKQFNETVQYKDSRYHVQWPWTESLPSLPKNLGLAWGRLNSLLKRLDNTELKAYDQVIQEQLQNGIIEKVPDSTIPQKHTVHYLPHHCVLSRDRSKKLRIVYDASAKTADNLSLNECLYRGPLMLEDLTGLLIKFREHPIGIVADVEKAFLQLGLQDLDRDVTRFLWLKDINCEANSDNVLHLRFCRVPFGVISSPFLLNAAIRFHLIRSNSVLMKQIAEDIYVDNIVTGAQTISDAQSIYRTSKKSFDSLSMNLREWNSNSQELISFIPDKFRAHDHRHVKVLGLMWDTHNDHLYLKSNFNDNNLETVQTKRDVLKIIASVYDPCGLAVPILLPAKLFFQRLWKEKVKWDNKLNDNLLIEWQQIASKFAYMSNIHIDRYYAQSLNKYKVSNQIEYELHCFTDSSMGAYAAVIYLRSSLRTNNIVSFVIGKSRLVPLKDQNNLQIPRLELLGVLIGCRLIIYVMKFLRLKIKAQFLWTDSQIVLSWYNSDKLLPPFVSRRISEIRQNKTLNVRYVPTKLNPSDVGTRADRVDSYYRWLKGPDFLSRDSELWPTTYFNSTDKDQTQIALAGEGLTNTIPTDNITGTGSDMSEPMITDNPQHPDNTETKRILQIQTVYFPREIEGITTDLSRSLQLYKDHDGLIRCRGRFRHTDLSHNQKEPILLPKNSEFTHKTIAELHQKNYHVGVSHTLALLRQNFWVPHGRSTVQKVIRKCLQCVKYGGGPFKLPAMPDLPSERVKLSLPFAFTGMDYFGPLFVDEVTQEKRWVCLFTCLTIRAIHMEVVKDLSAEECLLAIRRFVAVRGLPKLIVSDNATQFKLTADVLTSDYCILNNLRWKFIPELAPWFGGFYERLIGIVKHSMKRTLDKHLINHNQLCTAIKELEAIVNTRPLTTVGAELEHVLTPQDFLRVGGPVTTQTSDRDFLKSATVTKSNLIDGWKRGQIILLEFVKMFTNQYLTSLRERSDKHRQPRVVINRAPKLAETVQLRSDGNRAHWKVGKIAELIKGSDGQVRVARVKLPSGDTLTRSIGHLFPLEVEDQSTVPLPDHNDTAIRANHDSEEPRIEQPVPIQIDHSLRNNHNSGVAKVDDHSTSNETGTPEQPATDTRKRPIRATAAKAREMIKEWTSQLMIRLFNQ